MSDTISTYLNKIKNAKYGNEVLEAICGGLEECYSDVTSSSLKLQAFKTAIQELSESGAFTGLTLGNGSITGSKLADGSVTKNKLDPSVTFNIDSATQKALLDLLAKVDYTSENGKILYKRLKSTFEMDSFSKPKILSINFTEDAYTNKHYLTDDVSKYNFPVASNNDNVCPIYCRYYNNINDYNEGVGDKGFTILVRITGDLSLAGSDQRDRQPLIYMVRHFANNSWKNYTLGVKSAGQYKTTKNTNAQTGFVATAAYAPLKWSMAGDLPGTPYTLIMSFSKTGSITAWVNGVKIATGQLTDFLKWDTTSGFWAYVEKPSAVPTLVTGPSCNMKSYQDYDKLVIYEGAFSDSEAKTVNDFFHQ